MLLGDILVAKGLVSRSDLARALDYQREHGGRFGDCLVALGVCTAEQIDAVLSEAPAAPRNLEETGVDPLFLLSHMTKGMFSENLETPSQIADATCLPSGIVNALLKDAQDRKLAEAIGQSESRIGAVAEMRYALTRAGREWAADASEQCSYFGPAPVSFAAYRDRILLQRITNEWVSRPLMQKAFDGLVIPDRFLSRLGPAINSGTAILIYGPAGNGKTTIAEIVGKIFQNVIYVPHCFEVDGQIIKVFDPSVHRAIAGEGAAESAPRGCPATGRW